MELETRTCKCGCTLTFRVMPGNNRNFYFSKEHEEAKNLVGANKKYSIEQELLIKDEDE